MKIEKQVLLNDLKLITQQNIKTATQLFQYEFDVLNVKENDSWSALECIEHLNRYADFYATELECVISLATPDNDPIFKSGWLGNYFAKSMQLKPKLNKMKTFKEMNPINSVLSKAVISRFLDDQAIFLDLLLKAQEINLSKNKTKISISTILKLRIGDTFRVVIYHNQRHLDQALRASRIQ